MLAKSNKNMAKRITFLLPSASNKLVSYILSMYKDIVTIEFDDETVGNMYQFLKPEIDRFVEREGGNKKEVVTLTHREKANFLCTMSMTVWF